MPPLSESEISSRLKALPDWKTEAGLQGSGKTTAAAKLARWFRQQGRNPMLVGADLQRPAAVEQLRVLAEQAGHHPDIDIRYNRVRLALVTHDAGGITAKDFDLAGAANKLV